MANKVVYTLTCDRCTVPYSAPTAPDDWGTISHDKPDMPGGDICFACRCEFQDWWRAGQVIRRQPIVGPAGDTPSTVTREPVSLADLAAASKAAS